MMAETYDPSGQVNLRGYSATMATYAALVGATLVGGRLSGRGAPAGNSVADLVIGGVATHQLSRLLAKGSVASPLRAPFTEFEGPTGAAEHSEHARGDSGVRHTIGELLTCPFCLTVWLGTAYVAALAVAPRPTRAAAAVFSVVAISDWLHLGYEVARKKALNTE
jgi:hypothetical protein